MQIIILLILLFALQITSSIIVIVLLFLLYTKDCNIKVLNSLLPVFADAGRIISNEDHMCFIKGRLENNLNEANKIYSKYGAFSKGETKFLNFQINQIVKSILEGDIHSASVLYSDTTKIVTSPDKKKYKNI